MKNVIKSTAFLISVLFLSLVAGVFIFAWTEPSQTPPGGNVDAPINVGTSHQVKEGSIAVTALYDSNDSNYYVNPNIQSVLNGPLSVLNGPLYVDGKVGIGTTTPTGKLHIEGDSTSGYYDTMISGTDTKDGGAKLTLSWGTYSGTNPYMGTNTAHPFYFATNNAYRWGVGATGGTAFGPTYYTTDPGSGNVIIEGKVGIGTASPQRNLDVSTNGQITFGDNVVDDDTSGIYWHSGSGYGIYRTPGAWSTPDFQQLKIAWATGIVLDPGTAYGKSYVDISGQVKITGGSPGAGKVLTSDATGLATWVTPSASGIPSGMIAMFDKSCPSGWARFTALDNRFPLGLSTYGTVGGTATHGHTYSGTTGGSNAWGGGGEGAAYEFATRIHTHTYSGTTDPTSVLPPYLTVIWCKKD